MRKKNREMNKEDSLQCFDESPYATLSMVIDGDPYAVPLSCVRRNNIIYFHCAMEGLKTSVLQDTMRVWLSAVSFVDNQPDISTTYYRSCMIQGVLRKVDDAGEKKDALRAICERFSPAYRMKDTCIPATMVCAVHIDQISGKQNVLSDV